MIPEDLRHLVDQRRRAREARDFDLADALREQIRTAGFEIVDTPKGPELRPLSVPAGPASTTTSDFCVHWLAQGWPEDVVRGLTSFRRHEAERSILHVVVDATGEKHPWPGWAETIRVDPGVGWAMARNEGLRRSAARLVIVVDGSIEATGDPFGPIEDALSDPTVGLTGPFGIVSDDLREFRPSDGPDVDAVEGYLMAFRGELLEDGLAFDRRFAFYRTADIELSFQVKARGLRATVTPLPVTRHEHRVWANTPEDERARLSKRNFYRFLDTWRDRTDLLVQLEALTTTPVSPGARGSRASVGRSPEGRKG